MDLPDPQLVEALRRRDGPIPERYAPHSAEGVCRYSELYPDKRCPWCEAEENRRRRESAAAPRRLRAYMESTNEAASRALQEQ
jgi:hypothetical protein